MFFYFPYNMWRNWEGGKIKKILLDLNDPMLDEDDQKKRRSLLIEFLLRSRNTHKSYAFKFFFCEALNFINVIGQIYFINT